MAVKITSIEEIDNLGLTEEERAALAEQEAEETAAAAGKDGEDEAIEGKTAETAANGQADEGDKDGEGDKAAAAAASDTGTAAGKDPADDAGADDGEGEATVEARAAATIPDWQAPADAKDRLEAIEKEREKIAELFDNGEMTAKDLFAKQRELDKQEREIERAVERANMAKEIREDTWFQSTVPAFLDANTHYRDNETLTGLFDAEVRRQQVLASKAGKDPLSPAILVAADAAIRSSLGAFGIPAKPAGGAKPAPKQAGGDKDAQAGSDKDGKPKIPPTLGSLPTSEISGTDSKFAALDRMDPIALEAAMAKMPESEREMYLSRSH